jgi:hypothetical protein
LPDDPRRQRLYPDVPPAEPSEQLSAASPLRDEFIDRAAFDSWFAGYRARLRDEQVDDAQRQQRMQGVNPALVLRNWLAQRAIEQAEAGDMGELERLHAALAHPFTDRTDDYVRRPPDWGNVWKSAARANSFAPPRRGELFGQDQLPGMGLAQQIALAAMLNHYPSFAA